MWALASTLKLIGNGNLAAILELLAETLTLGEKSGIGQQTVYDLITGEPLPVSAVLQWEADDSRSEIMPAPAYACCQLLHFESLMPKQDNIVWQEDDQRLV